MSLNLSKTRQVECNSAIYGSVVNLRSAEAKEIYSIFL